MLAEKTGAMAYTVYAKTEELQQRWMEAIRMAQSVHAYNDSVSYCKGNIGYYYSLGAGYIG